MTQPQETKSEVARLMRQITEEYESAQRGLSSMAITAPHAFITARMENMEKLREELQQVVGEQDAIALVAEALERAEP